MLIIIYPFILISCVDTIPIDISNNENLIVIEGKIVNNIGPHTVSVRRSGTFSSDDLGFSTPLTAKVKIISDAGEVVELFQQNPGTYQTSNFKGEIGRSYYIEVQIDGNTYNSIPEKMLPVPVIEKIGYSTNYEESVNNFNNIVFKYMINFLVDFQAGSEESVYLKWELNGIYRYVDKSMFGEQCFVSDPLNVNNIAIFGNENEAGSYINDYEIKKLEVNSNFQSDYLVSVFQSSITKEAFNFWKQVQEVINLSGSLFDRPPGLIKGNIFNVNDPNEMVLGYFSASAVDTARFLIVAGKIPSVPEKNCDNLPSECICATKSNSTRIKPSYWP